MLICNDFQILPQLCSIYEITYIAASWWRRNPFKSKICYSIRICFYHNLKHRWCILVRYFDITICRYVPKLSVSWLGLFDVYQWYPQLYMYSHDQKQISVRIGTHIVTCCPIIIQSKWCLHQLYKCCIWNWNKYNCF